MNLYLCVHVCVCACYVCVFACAFCGSMLLLCGHVNTRLLCCFALLLSHSEGFVTGGILYLEDLLAKLKQRNMSALIDVHAMPGAS